MFDQLGLGSIMGAAGMGFGSSAAQQGAVTYGSQAGLAAQQQALYNQQLMSIHARQHAPKQWMVDGQAMDFDEFVRTVFPEDTPERTFFLLKYKK